MSSQAEVKVKSGAHAKPVHPSQDVAIANHKYQVPKLLKQAAAPPLVASKAQQADEAGQAAVIAQSKKLGAVSNQKKSTADLIRQRLNISSPAKKKAGQQGFSHSDEMQYKRISVLRDFQILSKLGDGAYSSVYKVRRLEDTQIYALKKVKIGMMSSKDKENAINEVRILSSIKHPNVVAYKEAFIDNETQTLNLVMQLADGGDLLKMISDRKKRKVHFRESQVWRVLIETVYGLKAMHELSIMHRDIKSANIFLFRNSQEQQAQGGNLYQSKLGDMNVSKVTKSNGLNYTQTGTPYYASPEVWKDEPYGFKSDVWSLGCVIYEMLALKPPFSGRDMDHLYKRVCKGVYPRIPEHYSNDIWAIVQLMLQVQPDKRPDCNSLIQSKMFQIYSDKLNSLESVDKTFQKTLKSCSPDRAEIKMITNSLLTQLHLPMNDISQLSGVLPRRNYESAQAVQPKGGSLLKSTSTNEEQSTSSRKVSKLRNQKEHSRQRTQLQQPTSMPESSATGENEGPSVVVNEPNSKQAHKLGKSSVSPTPKMTKIQSKLQRQYLQQQSSSLVQEGLTSSEHANRSLNPTMITNRSGSKQSLLKPNLNDSDVISDRENAQNSLRNRLSSKRKQVYKPGLISVERDGEVVDHNAQKMRGDVGDKKAVSVVKGSKQARHLHQEATKYGLAERNGQNLTPFRMDEQRRSLIAENHHLHQVSPMPSINHQDPKSNSLKQTRLSLPQVSAVNHSRDRSLQNNSMPESVHSSTPAHHKSAALALQMRNSDAGIQEVGKSNNIVMALPQLSEVESDKISPPQLRTRRDSVAKQLSLKHQLSQSPAERVATMPSVVKQAAEEGSDGNYHRFSTGSSPHEGIKQGKRHASFDVLVSPTNGSQIFQSNQQIGSPMMPAQLIASQNVLAPQQVSDLGAKSTRVPESQSYSQINVMNKAQLGISTGKGIVQTTSDSEDLGIVKTSIAHSAHKNELRLKNQLVHRFNGPQHAVSSQNATLLSLDHRIAHPRPSIQSHGPEVSMFTNNQQSSMRHLQSEANFSLNSDELRHGHFQLAHLHGGKAAQPMQLGMVEQKAISSTRRKADATNSAIRLPQIDSRKKSLDARTVRDGQNAAAKLSASLKHSRVGGIAKKKPSVPPQAHYYSVVPNSSTNGTASLAHTLGSSNKNMASLQSLGAASPLNVQNSMTIKNNQNLKAAASGQSQQQSAQLAIKKKTLAAYANTRARNPRNNLIYTQKHNSAAQ